MIAAKNMVRHLEFLENFTKIMISFQISRIAYIAYNDTQFSICVQLFDACNTCFKAFSVIKTLQICAVRAQMCVFDLNDLDQLFDLMSVHKVLA